MSAAGDSLLVVVPARGGSKRLPGKNLRTLGGRNLLRRADDALVEAGLDDAPRLLSTDSEEIAAAGREIGWLVPFLRPAALAEDDTPTLPVILHALDRYAESAGAEPELVLVLQVTSPFRRGASLRRGLDMLAENGEADAVIGARELHLRPRHVFERDRAGYLRPLREDPDGSPALVPNGAFYLVRTAALRREATLIPRRTLACVMDAVESVDIDTPLDWRLAEAILGAGMAA